MGVGIASSESKTDTKTLNQQITAADQAVVWAPRKSGNSKINIGKGAQLSINNGLSREDFTSSLNAAFANFKPGTRDNSPQEQLEEVVGQRIEDNEAAADEAIATQSATFNWKIIGGVVLLVALIAVFTVWRRTRK